MKERVWIPFTGVAIVCALLMCAVGTWNALSGAFAIASVISAIGAVLHLLRDRSEGRYSLDALQRVHEQAQIDALDVPEPEEFDSVHCMCCGSVYNNRLPVCPSCGRPQ